MKKIEPIPPSLPLLTKGEFYLEDEEIFSGLLIDRKSTRLNSSHHEQSRMPSSA